MSIAARRYCEWAQGQGIDRAVYQQFTRLLQDAYRQDITWDELESLMSCAKSTESTASKRQKHSVAKDVCQF